MKVWNFLLTILLFTGLVPSTTLFSQNSFELTYATPDNEEILDGILHSSGKVYLVGRTRTYYSGEIQPFILKISGTGELESHEFLSEDTVGFFSQVLELNNGNLMLIGQCGLSSEDGYSMRWIKIIDSELNNISNHIFVIDTSYNSVYQNNALVDNIGDVVVLGAVEFEENKLRNSSTDFFIAKYSQDGDSLAFQVYSNPNHIEEVYDLTCIPETNQYLALTSAFFTGMPTPQIVRIGQDLGLIDNMWFTNSSDIENPCKLNNWLSNSTYILTGLKLDWDGYDDQVGVYKADTTGNINKTLELGKPDTIDYPAWFNALAYINDSTIYIGGFMDYITFWTTEPSYIELYLIDTNLNLLGYRQFGGDINYQLYGITATADGGCLMYTSTYSENNQYQEGDVRIFKVPRDSLEIITQIIDIHTDNHKYIPAYPNPVSDVINIPLDGYHQNINIQLYKFDGKKVYDATISGSGNLVSINVNNLSSGTYIYKMSSKNTSLSSGKFIKK